MIRFILGCIILLLAAGCQTTNESTAPVLTAQSPATDEEIQASHDAMSMCLLNNLVSIEDGISDADAIASTIFSACVDLIGNNLSAVARGHTDIYPKTVTDEFQSAFKSMLASGIRKNRDSSSFECFRTKDGLCHTRGQFKALTKDAFACVKQSVPEVGHEVIGAEAVASRVFDMCAGDFAPTQGKTETNELFRARTIREISSFVHENRA